MKTEKELLSAYKTLKELADTQAELIAKLEEQLELYRQLLAVEKAKNALK